MAKDDKTTASEEGASVPISQQASVNLNQPRLLRKITVKDVMRGVDYEKGENTVIRDLFVVYGTAREFNMEESSYKDARTGEAQKYERYIGDFEAMRYADGALFKSYECILDQFSSSVLRNQFLHAKKDNEDATVDFAFIIGVEPHKRGDETKARHTLRLVNAGDVAPIDPLANLRGSVLKQLPQLGGPTVLGLTDQRETATA